MKKFLLFVVAAITIFTFASCGNKNKDNDNNTSSSNNMTTTTRENTTNASTTANDDDSLIGDITSAIDDITGNTTAAE